MAIIEVKCDGVCRDCTISYVKKDEDGIEVFACKTEDNPEIEVIVEDPFAEGELVLDGDKFDLAGIKVGDNLALQFPGMGCKFVKVIERDPESHDTTCFDMDIATRLEIKKGLRPAKYIEKKDE